MGRPPWARGQESAQGRSSIANTTPGSGRRNEADASPSLQDVSYPGGFYREQAPIHLKYICALNGVRSPTLDGGFTYCEIGCGSGETIALLAASNPAGLFYGIDLSTSHIEQATALARAGGLSNLTLIAGDIAQLPWESLPDFDFVTLHGLYSWVPDSVQAAIRAFLATKLKPGGVAYVSYNAMPGWGSAGALRRFFVDQAKGIGGDLLEQSRQVVERLRQLRHKGAPFFRENPTAAGILSRLLSADPRYIAHEYLGPTWQPRYFADVHDEMAANGLCFVGEGGVVENLLEHSVMPELVDLLRAETDRRSRETLRDFVQNRFFRRDIYVRPETHAPGASADELIQHMLFGLIAAPVQVPDTVNLVDAPALRFAGLWFDRIKTLLAYKVHTLAEILSDPVLRACPAADLVEGVKLLTVGGFCAPFAAREVIPPRGPSETIKVVPLLNQVRLEGRDWSAPSFTLASPVMGSGVSLNGLEAALLDAVQRPDPITWAWSELRRRDIELRSSDEKTPVTDEAQGKQALRQALDQFLRHKLPKLAYLGVVEAA